MRGGPGFKLPLSPRFLLNLFQRLKPGGRFRKRCRGRSLFFRGSCCRLIRFRGSVTRLFEGCLPLL